MKRLVFITVIFLSLMPFILSTCGGGSNTKPSRQAKEKLTGFQYKQIKRKLLILPIKGRGDSNTFQEVHRAIRNTLDNHYIVVEMNKKFKATASKEKALRYCAKAEADLVMLLSYLKAGKGFIFNVTIYAFEDQGKKRISRSFTGKGSDFVIKLSDFLNKDLSPSLTRRYPKVFKGTAPAGVKVLDETPGGLPDWISNIPNGSKYQYFVGEIGGMENKKRARREAINEALWNMALGVESIVEGVSKHSIKEKASGKNRQLIKQFKSDLRITTRVTLRGAKEVKNYYRQVQLPTQKPVWEYYVLMRYPKPKLLKKIVKVAKKAEKTAKKKGSKKFVIARQIIRQVKQEVVENDSSLTQSVKVFRTEIRDYVPVVAVKKKKNVRTAYSSFGSEDMVKIPGGTFTSGKDGYNKDNPPKKRRIKTFYLDKYEVTVKKYRQVMGRLPDNEPSWGWKDNHPVVNITWHEATNYCKKQGKRLPTEWEWEYAAAGPEKFTWPNGNSFTDSDYSCSVGSKDENSTSPVGSYQPNGYGLYDIGGNVWEWTSSWYDANNHVLRGGSWNEGTRHNFRVSYRHYYTFHPLSTTANGFRCAR